MKNHIHDCVIVITITLRIKVIIIVIVIILFSNNRNPNRFILSCNRPNPVLDVSETVTVFHETRTPILGW